MHQSYRPLQTECQQYAVNNLQLAALQGSMLGVLTLSKVEEMGLLLTIAKKEAFIRIYRKVRQRLRQGG